MSIEALQKEMLNHEQVEIKTRHIFCNGCYAREITIPAGVMLVGAKHKTEHFHVISKGKCAVSNMGEQEIFEAPYTGITKPGSKRAIVAITETVFTTFHPTNETDINKIEEQIIEPEGLKISNNQSRIALDNEDHERFLLEFGISEELERTVMSHTDDLDLSPIKGVYKSKSKIHGDGMFCDSKIKSGQIIGHATSNRYRTLLGRFCNHSISPNARPEKTIEGEVMLVARSDIDDNEEVTVNYREMISVCLEGLCPG